MNYCINCIHHTIQGHDVKKYRACKHPKAEEYKNLVNGYWPKCEDMRHNSFTCNRSGEWFEPKPPEAVPS